MLLKAYSDLGFATKQDFENILALPTKTRKDRIAKQVLITQGISLLNYMITEPTTTLIEEPEGSGNFVEHQIVEIDPNWKPMWQRYGFSDIPDVQAMLVRYEAV